MGERFKVRKRWFKQEYWVYDVREDVWLTFFSSRVEADELCVKLNRGVRVGDVFWES